MVEPSPSDATAATASAALEDALSASANAAAEPRLPVRILRAIAPGLGAVVLLLAVWQLVVWSGWKPDWVLPGPLAVSANTTLSRTVFQGRS